MDAPLSRLREWLADASLFPEEEATKMVLATVGADGRPSARVVLLKDLSAAGLVFYTNLGSRKAAELAGNPAAALCFHWASLGKQIRVEGDIAPLPASVSDAYFATRPRDSQIGAWASRQSEVCREGELEAHVAELTQRFAGRSVPRPEFWGGYVLVPQMIEFWRASPHRLHRRERYQFTSFPNDYGMDLLFP